MIDFTRRAIRSEKRSILVSNQPKYFSKLISPIKQWIEVTTGFEKHFKAAVGAEAYLVEYCEHTELQRRSGLGACKRLLS